jgi:hypothetical protein
VNNKSPLLIALITGVLICQLTFAESNSGFPSHCTPAEFAYLNAKMGKVEYDDRGIPVTTKNGKILSICTDKKTEPFNKVVYRYGQIGKVEMEEIASATNRFGIFNRTTSPHTGENIISFSKGAYNYYVTEATAQGSGISLIVYKSGKQIVNMFSGNSYGTDFEAGLIELNFDKVSSPIFVKNEPSDRL